MAPVNKGNIEERAQVLSKWITDEYRRLNFQTSRRGNLTDEEMLRVKELRCMDPELSRIEKELKRRLCHITDYVDLSKRLEILEDRMRVLNLPAGTTLLI